MGAGKQIRPISTGGGLRAHESSPGRRRRPEGCSGTDSSQLLVAKYDLEGYAGGKIATWHLELHGFSEQPHVANLDRIFFFIRNARVERDTSELGVRATLLPLLRCGHV